MVPLVKCNKAMSSAAVGTISKESDADDIAAARSIVSAGRVEETSVSNTCLRLVSSLRQGSTLRRYSASEVMRTDAWPIAMRVLMDSGPNAEKRGLNTLPCLSVPAAR